MQVIVKLFISGLSFYPCHSNYYVIDSGCLAIVLLGFREQVRVDGYGVFLLLIYPGAYVDLHKEHLSAISPRRQLRIYSAGVWHNIVLTLISGVFLWLMTLILYPVFTTGLGAVVTHVSKVGISSFSTSVCFSSLCEHVSVACLPRFTATYVYLCLVAGSWR